VCVQCVYVCDDRMCTMNCIVLVGSTHYFQGPSRGTPLLTFEGTGAAGKDLCIVQACFEMRVRSLVSNCKKVERERAPKGRLGP
jgi:hypothetical protein